MDKVKQWVALTAVGVLAVMAAGWFLVVSPKRSEAADIRGRVDVQMTTVRGLQASLTRLKEQAKALPQQQARLAAVAAKIPDNPALPALIRALTTAADNAGVELLSLAPSAPSVVAPAGGAAAQRPSTGAVASSTAGTTASGAAGTLQQIGLSLNVVGGYFQVEQFFDQVENLSRALKVTGFTLAPGRNPMKVVPAGAAAVVDDGNRTAQITANVYMSTGRTSASTVTAPVAGK